MDLKEQTETVKKIAIGQLELLQKKRKLSRLAFVRELNKVGYKITIQAYYDLLNSKLSTDTTIKNIESIKKLLGEK